MKKYIIPLVLVSLAMVGCKTNDQVSLTIVTPTGAPALAFYKHAKDENFETNNDPSNIAVMMAAGQKDVVVLPTNAGMQAIVKNNVPYKIAATITFGNFYIASLNNDENNEMDASDTILLFQQNSVPDKIFHYVYGNDFDSNIHYVNAVSDAAAACISGQFTTADGNKLTPNYVLLAQPVLTNVLSKKDTVTVYANIQNKYQEKSEGKKMFQASVFIKDTVEEKDGLAFLDSLKADIEGAIENPSLLEDDLNQIENAQEKYGVAPAMAKAVLANNNGMGLGFAKAKDNKAAIENFLGIFGIKDIDEKVYF